MSKTPRPKATSFQKKLLRLIDDYCAETGETDVDLHDIAEWAIKTERYVPPRYDPVKQLRREMQRASRQEYIEDDNGRPVRRRHCYKIKRGEVQLTLWSKIEEITRKNMRLSARGRRGGILADCIQLTLDLEYYNDNFNPGEPIQPSFNFEPDLIEKLLPSEYKDAPPDDDDEKKDDKQGGPNKSR
jgi:hypothetical protein